MKSKIIFLNGLLLTTNNTSMVEKSTQILDNIKVYYSKLNENNYFKYGKYIIGVGIILYILKIYIEGIFFKKITFKKELQKKLLLRNEMINHVTSFLNDEEKFQFLSKCSLNINSIYKENNNYKFQLNYSKLDENLKNKIKTLDIFEGGSFFEDYIFGKYNLKKINKNKIYEIECSNEGKDSNSSNKCSIISTKHGFIHYFLKLKKLNNKEILNNFGKSLDLFNDFIEIFYSESITDNSIKNNFLKLIQNNNINDWMMPEKFSLDEYFINKGLNNLNEAIYKKTYKDEDIEKLINKVFHKLIDIIEKIQTPGDYHLTVKSIKYFFQIFNYKIGKINKDYLLPEVYVKLPFIDSMITLNPFLQIEIQADILFNHLQYHFYTLNKEEALEFKKFIEHWINKYESNNKRFLKILLKTHGF